MSEKIVPILEAYQKGKNKIEHLTADFDEKGAIFFGKTLKSEHILLGH